MTSVLSLAAVAWPGVSTARLLGNQPALTYAIWPPSRPGGGRRRRAGQKPGAIVNWYCLKAPATAPPDIGPAGPDWGLPAAADGSIIAARAYWPFIDLLRALIVQNCGALRIDHVMSVLRLWWIPYGETMPTCRLRVSVSRSTICCRFGAGASVIAALVIGEDLGTVRWRSLQQGYATAASIL